MRHIHFVDSRLRLMAITFRQYQTSSKRIIQATFATFALNRELLEFFLLKFSGMWKCKPKSPVIPGKRGWLCDQRRVSFSHQKRVPRSHEEPFFDVWSHGSFEVYAAKIFPRIWGIGSTSIGLEIRILLAWENHNKSQFSWWYFSSATKWFLLGRLFFHLGTSWINIFRIYSYMLQNTCTFEHFIRKFTSQPHMTYLWLLMQ